MSIPHSVFEELHTLCRNAWQRHLFSGFNGNVSRKLDAQTCCITRSGAPKGFLEPDDLSIVDIASGKLLEGLPPSSELAMHREIYQNCPDTEVILHTHPLHLLALDLISEADNFLNLPLFEAQVLRARLGFSPALPPGTLRLALSVAEAARTHEAVWMARHGLCCCGSSARDVLALSEELEHLAAIQLLTGQRTFSSE